MVSSQFPDQSGKMAPHVLGYRDRAVRTTYPGAKLHIAGKWRSGAVGRTLPVVDPATGCTIGRVPVAGRSDLDEALTAADNGFAIWRNTSASERSRILRIAAAILRSRADEIAYAMTLEQGKRLSESRLETLIGAEIIEWYAEEGRRLSGRTLPRCLTDVEQFAYCEPIGPVAAFPGWNFPLNHAVRKVAPALAAGCSIIIKGPSEAPASVAALVQAFLDAGVPSGVMNLVFGESERISAYLISHPVIRKISFTGSRAIGKRLAALAGAYMKRISMELGGQALAIVCDDADLDSAVTLLATQKFWNAGQVSFSPSRFLVQQRVYGAFVASFAAAARTMKVGSGLARDTRIGPLANSRRLYAMEGFVADAVEKGAKLQTGGRRAGNAGFFFEPTVLSDVPIEARIMNEDPLGPIASICHFDALDEAIAEANRRPHGRAAYAFTSCFETSTLLQRAIRSDMVAVNTIALAMPEIPFGGSMDSGGGGSQRGSEAIEAYLDTKFVSRCLRWPT